MSAQLPLSLRPSDAASWAEAASEEAESSVQPLRNRIIVPLQTDGMYPATRIDMVNGQAYTVDMERQELAELLSAMHRGEFDYVTLPDPQAIEPFMLWRDALKYVTILARHWIPPHDIQADKFAEEREISIARAMPIPRARRRHQN